MRTSNGSAKEHDRAGDHHQARIVRNTRIAQPGRDISPSSARASSWAVRVLDSASRGCRARVLAIAVVLCIRMARREVAFACPRQAKEDQPGTATASLRPRHVQVARQDAHRGNNPPTTMGSSQLGIATKRSFTGTRSFTSVPAQRCSSTGRGQGQEAEAMERYSGVRAGGTCGPRRAGSVDRLASPAWPCSGARFLR